MGVESIAGTSSLSLARAQDVPIPGHPDIGDLLGRGLSALQRGVVERTLDGLGSLARGAAGQARDQIVGWADKVKDQLAALPGQAANALADSMRGPGARPLTPGETAAVQQAFGGSVDLSNVRIVEGPGRNPDAWVAFNVGGNPAITEGNTVYIKDGYSADLSTSPDGVRTLVHEFTHVRQFQQLGFGAFAAKYAHDLVASGGDRDKPYHYETRETPWRNETLEGQAEMVGDLAYLRAGGNQLPADRRADIEQRLTGTGIYGR